jgi:gamma-glutamyltranspeptidase/glutathione hydrolase
MTTQPTITRVVKEEARAPSAMVATKDREATRAGLRMLAQGGNAIDAAVASCFAIGVLEPASSGIGGGGYLVYQVGDQGGVIGFPMKGPLSAKPDMYELTGEAATGSFGWPGVVNDDNIEGFRSIATPGAVAGLCEAHRRFGKLPLSEVLAPAVSLARDGFIPNLFGLNQISSTAGMLMRYDELRRVLMPGDNMPMGDVVDRAVLKQPELANILEAIGKGGPDAFYKGDIAKALTSDIQNNGGSLSEEDMASYKPIVWDKGLEFKYRGHTVRVPPFACAGITSAMTLKLLDGFDVPSMGHNSADMLHSYISCARLAYADRFQYLADPAFADVPWNGLVSDDYTELRRATIGDRMNGSIEAGNPWIQEGREPTSVLPASRPAEDKGTTHLVVTDSEGNGVSITNTIMSGFGSGIIPKGTGVVMNNGMMWFDPVPGRINSIAPGRLPLNNMTPALVMNRDGVRMAVGASGGRRITNCVTQQIIKVIDYDMGPQAAIDSPRIDCSTPHTSVDPRLDPDVVAELEARGHDIRSIPESFIESGFPTFASPVAIVRGSDGVRGGVDTFQAAYAEGL